MIDKQVSQVLYRKWRPINFSSVYGQQHVTHTLKQAVVQGRIAHAYLFCGPRGTGKTSTARILAKSINCNEAIEGEPCNTCDPCTAINEGRNLDIIEMDAASNRGIEDVRGIREKVNYTPAVGRYKVYIIDEVHMMSIDAFNAILKTLEEPPDHAIFVLATTEIQRVPATIISRCQRFDFHRITNRDVETCLAQICETEEIQVEPEALRLIGLNSSGSLRDAQNLLEQVVTSYGSSLSKTKVQELLGITNDPTSLQLVHHIISGEVRDGLNLLNNISENGVDPRLFHRQVVNHLRTILLFKSGLEDPLQLDPEMLGTVKEIAESTSVDNALFATQLFSAATPQPDTNPLLPLELALVECSLRIRQDLNLTPRTQQETAPVSLETPADTTDTQLTSNDADQPKTEPGPDSSNYSTYELTNDTEDLPYKSLPSSESSNEAATITIGSGPVEEISTEKAYNQLPEDQWISFKNALKTYKANKFNFGALLNSCIARYIDGEDLILVFRHRSNMDRLQGEMQGTGGSGHIHDTLRQVTGKDYTLRLSLSEQENSGPVKPTGHLVRVARAFGAEITEGVSENHE